MNIDETQKKEASASYIIVFYNEIIQLGMLYAQYLNYLVELEYKYKGFDLKLMPEEEMKLLNIALQTVRGSAIKTYTQYTVLKEYVKNKSNDDVINKSYEKIKNNFIIDRKDLETFVTEINKFLVNNVIDQLLKDSKDILEEIYK